MMYRPSFGFKLKEKTSEDEPLASRNKFKDRAERERSTSTKFPCLSGEELHNVLREVDTASAPKCMISTFHR